MEKEVGKVIRVEYDSDSKDMQIILSIKDEEYKRKILRDFRHSDKLLIKGDIVMAVVDGRKENNNDSSK